MRQFETIREFSRRGVLREHTVRTMVKRGEVPGFYQGSRYYIDVSLFLEALNAKSQVKS